MTILSAAATPTATWLSGIGALLTGIAALSALGLVGWSEARKLRSQHDHDERSRLQALIGRYHGPLLEAAIDWDRRMHQLYQSKRADPERYGEQAEGLTEMEWFMDDEENYGTDNWVYGKFCDPDQYVFRSFVFRFLVLCSLARKFEAEAFYHDAQVARAKDFQFLKYAKAFLWAPTHGDLHPDDIPSQDHFPNDEFRPILDRCYRDPGRADAEEEPIFDLGRLDKLVTAERPSYTKRLKSARADYEARLVRRIAPPAGDGVKAGADQTAKHEADETSKAEADATSKPEVDTTRGRDLPAFERPYPRGIGRVILFFIGLRRPTWRDGTRSRLTRYNWDRLCVMHLLVMAFINDFGYPWQRRTEEDLDAAASAIVDVKVAQKFDEAIPSLGLSSTKAGGARQKMDAVKGVISDRIARPDPDPDRSASEAGVTV